MTVRVVPEMLAYLRANSGGIVIVVSGTPPAAVGSGLRTARRRISAIHHPEQPDEAFPSFVGEAVEINGGWSLSLDMADAEAYDGILEALRDVVVTALEEAGVDEAVVGFPSGSIIEADATEPTASAAAPATRPVEMPADFPLPPRVRMTGDLVLEGRGFKEFMVDLPSEDLVEFYSAALEAAGYAVTGLETEPESDFFKARYFFDFNGHGLFGWLMVTIWPFQTPMLGYAALRIDTWQEP